MAHFYLGVGAIAGDGYLFGDFSDYIISLDTLPGYFGGDSHSPVAYRGLGVAGWRTSGAPYPTIALRYLLNSIAERPPNADSLFYQLAPGLTGYLTLGYDVSSEIVPHVEVARSAVFTLPNTTWTVIPWDSNPVDVLGSWSAGDASKVYCLADGLYLAQAESCSWDNWSAAWFRSVLRVGGTDLLPIRTQLVESHTERQSITIDKVLRLSSGQYLEVAQYQSGGGGINSGNGSKLTLTRIGA